MPTYGYFCKNCEKEIDIFQKITDQDIKNCPHCKSENFVKKIGGGFATFSFKGDGFYYTDYKRKENGCKKCEDNKCPKKR